MTLSKVLWTALTGLIILCSMLLGNWGMTVSHRQDSLEAQQHVFDLRAATLEQHYAAIEAQYMDLHEELRDIQRSLQPNGH